MGTPPINPIRVYGTGGESSGSATPPNRNLQDAANSFADAGKDAAGNMDTLTQRLEKAQRMGKDLAKVFKDNSSELKHMIEYADDMSDSLKAWQDWNSKLARQPGIFRDRDRRQVMAFLDDFLASSKRLNQSKHFFTVDQQKAITDALKKTAAMADELASSTEDALDDQKVDEMTRAFVKLNTQIAKMSDRIGKVPVGRLTAGFRDINKILQGTPLEKFGKIGTFLDKIHNVRQARADFRTGR